MYAMYLLAKVSISQEVKEHEEIKRRTLLACDERIEEDTALDGAFLYIRRLHKFLIGCTILFNCGYSFRTEIFGGTVPVTHAYGGRGRGNQKTRRQQAQPVVVLGRGGPAPRGRGVHDTR